jgi:hypothetical protein
MDLINSGLRTLTQLYFACFDDAPPIVPLAVISAIFGILITLCFRYTTPQKRLRRVVELARGEFLAIKLFKNDPIVVLRSFGRLLAYSALRVLYALPSLLIMLPLTVLLLSHLALWYEYRPLYVGESAFVEIKINEPDWEEYRTIEMQTPTQVAVETQPVRDDQSQSISWRIGALSRCSDQLSWHADNKRFQKSIEIAKPEIDFRAVSVRRPGPNWWDQIVNPGEAPFGKHDIVQSSEVHYPQRINYYFGWEMPWWMFLFIVACLAALIVRPFVGVQF